LSEVREEDSEEERGFLSEAGSALGAGAASVAESIGGAFEMLGVPGAKTAKEYWQDVGESKDWWTGVGGPGAWGRSCRLSALGLQALASDLEMEIRRSEFWKEKKCG